MNAATQNRIFLGLKIALSLCVLMLICYIALIPLWASDEEKISAVISSVLESARQRKTGAMTADVSEQYTDDFHHSKDELHKTLTYVLFFIYKECRVDILEGPYITIDTDGEFATAVLRARVRLGTQSGVEPTNDPIVEKYRKTDVFTVHLEKKNDRWLIVRCDSEVPEEIKLQ
jgi:hypothetical protein